MFIPNPSIAAAPKDVQAHAARLIALHGARGAASKLGISRHIVMAIASGSPVYAGTRLLAMEALRQRGGP